MRKKALAVLLTLLCALPTTHAEERKAATPSRVRIGVDIQLGFQSCMDLWTPVADYLSKTIPEHHFVIVPLASRQDVVQTLEKGDIEFLVLDPAMGVLAYDRFKAVPLLTMVETRQGKTPSPANAACSGTLIRRSDRSDIHDIQSIRGQRLSAVKPWSLTGWIAQWGLLAQNGIDPQKQLKVVVFDGTNEDVVKSVLDGSADVGAVDADMLLQLIRDQKVSAGSLCFINREGHAVPLAMDESDSSTDAYPGRVLFRAEATSPELAERVTSALMKQSVVTNVNHVPYQVSWSVPCNYSKVRRLLQELMGPNYAESPGFPLPWQDPSWLLPLQLAGIVLAVSFLGSALMSNRFRRRGDAIRAQLEDVRRELLQVRAEQQRINTILSLAGCGIDIVDDENRIVYADSSLERRYGDWHGRKCHDYFCGSSTPCPKCHRPFPINERCETAIDMDCSEWTISDDSQARVYTSDDESMRMIGVPFRDEGGRWLYARVHFPLAAFSKQCV